MGQKVRKASVTKAKKATVAPANKVAVAPENELEVASPDAVGQVNKKTKEFRIPRTDKDFRIFGYEMADTTAKRIICFSSHEGDVRANYNNCPLGAYYDTDKMKPGDRIQYVGITGPFAKMIFVGYDGKKTLFFIPKKYLVAK
jgi:hypothetical protein